MTTPLRFTQAAIRRAVKGARSAGLTVQAVRVTPGGDILVHTGDAPPLAPVSADAQGEYANFQA